MKTKQQNRKSGCFTERRGNRFFVFFLVDYIVPLCQRKTAVAFDFLVARLRRESSKQRLLRNVVLQIIVSGTCFGIGRSQEEASFMTDEVEDLPRVSNKRRLLRLMPFQNYLLESMWGKYAFR